MNWYLSSFAHQKKRMACNQMLGLKIGKSAGQHLKDFNIKDLEEREISINQHYYGCTAEAGSSCQGSVT